MGKGLLLESTGEYIAFASGAGVLSFLDLVAHIALTNLNILNPDENAEDCIQPNNFKLYLYVSHYSWMESIGLDLCETLQTFCDNNDYDNFELYVCLKQEGINRRQWDYDFIKDELSKRDLSEVKRIWVSGPPIMNETFDKALDRLRKTMPNLTKDKYDII